MVTACGRLAGAGELGSPEAADPATRAKISAHIPNHLDVISLPRSIATFGWPNTQLPHPKQERGDWFSDTGSKKDVDARHKAGHDEQERS
jgi:hypothetical protein